jgi:hypothetical protein
MDESSACFAVGRKISSLSDSMMVVFPEPFQPTMRVSGAVKTIVSPFSGPKERMPWIIMRSICDMVAGCALRELSLVVVLTGCTPQVEVVKSGGAEVQARRRGGLKALAATSMAPASHDPT